MKTKTIISKNKKLIYVTVGIVLLGLNLLALSPEVDVKIRVIDVTTKEGIPFCSIELLKENKHLSETVTDIDGNALLKIPGGNYEFKCRSIGFSPQSLNVNVSAGNNTFSIELKSGTELNDVSMVGYQKPVMTTSTKEERIVSVSHSNFSTVDVSSAEYKSNETIVTGNSVSHGRYKKYRSTAGGTTKPEKGDFTSNESLESLLTGGEINDFSKWKLWENESKNTLLQLAQDFGVHTDTRYCINVVDQNGNAVIDATVKLLDSDALKFTTHTDNKGFAECWTSGEKKNLTASVTYGGKTKLKENIRPFEQGINTILIERECDTPASIDIAFVVDATMSMSDEIDYLKSDVLGLINTIRSTKNTEIRVASVFYRDENDRYRTEFSDFTKNIDKAISYIKEHGADGGGDIPELMEYGLLDAANLSWSENARARIIFLIADAPPHNTQNSRDVLDSALTLNISKGVRIVPLACSEATKTTELLMRNMALLSNGTYLYLTDKSGIGGSHADPTTDKIDNKKLSSLMLSVLKRFTRVQNCNTPVTSTETNDALNINQSSGIEQFIQDQITDQSAAVSLKLNVTPNPTTGEASVNCTSKMNEVFVYDSNGKVLKRIKADSNKVDLNLSDLGNGEYIVKATSDTNSGIAKIIVRK